MKRSEAIRLRKLMEKAAELSLGDAEALEIILGGNDETK